MKRDEAHFMAGTQARRPAGKAVVGNSITSLKDFFLSLKMSYAS